MPSRRQVLQGILSSLGWLSLVGVGGCGSRDTNPLITCLRQALPSSLLKEWRQQEIFSFTLQLLDNRLQLFEQLQASASPSPQPWWDPLGWFQTPPTPAMVSLLGADWLDQAIAQALIAPLTPADVGQFWASLPPIWQQVVQRSASSPEKQAPQIWGVPWRWGSTAIVYHRQRLKTPIVDWADLWRPELRGKLTLPDHPREVIGLTLKKMGRSYQDPISLADGELNRQLAQLHQQVLTYTSSDYLPILRLEDSWVAVGWTEDLYQTQKNYPELEVVIPASGSAIWWDVWVLPRVSQNAPTRADLARWFDWVLDPTHTARMVNLSQIANVQAVEASQLSPSLAQRPDLSRGIPSGSEIWQPLSPEQADVYLTLWQRMRSGELLPR
ncbi:MAG: extracellular solute-binding protein [Cyanobacteriota bacterium]|nr:extracellular solute-binding protein [Cyanobacteriota bacterium]